MSDLISRAKALLSVKNSIINWCERNYLKEKAEDCVRYVQDGIEEVPSVSTKKQGKWIKKDNTFKCPFCGAYGVDIKEEYFFNYCPYCGADLRGRNDE